MKFVNRLVGVTTMQIIVGFLVSSVLCYEPFSSQDNAGANFTYTTGAGLQWRTCPKFREVASLSNQRDGGGAGEVTNRRPRIAAVRLKSAFAPCSQW